MNLLQNRMIQVLAAVVLVIGIGSAGYFLTDIGNQSEYKDLPPDHWAYEYIHWGLEEGIITGYADGTVHPDKKVTEAELLAMLFRTYGDLPDQEFDPSLEVEGDSEGKSEVESEEEIQIENGSEGLEEEIAPGDWAVKYYDQARLYNWEVWGRGSRNQLISRVDLAVIVSSALGYNLSHDGAIQNLLDLGIVEGKHSSTLDGYGLGQVTRAEALKVMKTLVEYGVTELQKRPLTASPEPVIQSEFKDKMTPLMEYGKEQGYDIYFSAWSREVGFSTEGEGILFLTYRSATSSDNQLVHYAADQERHHPLAEGLLSELGVPVDNQIADLIEQVRTQRKAVSTELENWELYITPGNLDSYVQIYFRKMSTQ
ncbi:S-layer homology domain-containing protein [Caldalkalibacillus mannanilyticus]|uniref:S-layer homology domain-containing protein n=1 Tax=Caldalkalibacillus mannanilyticus TaxID=1418 RepID=UPI000469E51C|nr:S-layer homology domain-containing protein [Caldalkalibacillus mannanilyticus]